jgi:hypothetical protein
MSNPFRYFNGSPEVIRLVVMMYVASMKKASIIGLDLAKRSFRRTAL